VRGAFLAGYAAVWTGFGALAFLGDVAVHRTVDAVPWLSERPWLVAGSVLALAGAFQFSDLKERCLSKCRHPGPVPARRLPPRGGGRLPAPPWLPAPFSHRPGAPAVTGES
jgi:predicted metal-binding membrane protein